MEDNQRNQEDLSKSLIDLYTNNYNKLYACVYRMTGNHQDAEDILQNSFIKAYQKLDLFKGNAKLYTWVYRIVMNESFRYFEYIKKLPLIRITEELGVSESEFLDSLTFEPNLEDHLIVEEMREKCLQGFLKCLPRKQRVCFLFKNLLELENRDIAEILDISVDNVKVTLHRGRKRLQEMFEMRCNLIDPDKPCKCHLWIKYMKDHNLPIPEGYQQVKSEDLKQEYFKNLNTLHKIEYLYHAQARITKDEFLEKLRRVAEIL